MILSRVSAKGRTTVPRSVREALGVDPGDALIYRIEGGQVFVTKADNEPGDDRNDDAEVQVAIDELLNDPRPSVPAEDAFARVFAHIDGMRSDRNAA